MEEFDIRILNSIELIKNAEYILIGAGSGLSSAAGLKYTGEMFYDNFNDFIKKYNFQDLYSATFYNFSTEEEKWAFWSRLIMINRYNEKSLELYKEIFKVVKEKDYFVITTNVDAQFEKAGFEKEKIFAVQGDYGYMQCENSCHNKLYYNEEIIKNMVNKIKECKIPFELVPKCPICGSNMEINLRKDANFVQDKNWYKQEKEYEKFLEKICNKNVVFIEIGVGFNTPMIIKYPFENMVNDIAKAKLIRINKEYSNVPLEIKSKSISFSENVMEIIQNIKERSVIVKDN